MIIVDVSNVTNLLLLLLATLLLVFLGKELKKPQIPAIPLITFLVLLIMHSIQITILPELNYSENYSILTKCLAIDFIMIFISFFSYLWVDDISCKFYKKKNIDNSLDWFWKNV